MKWTTKGHYSVKALLDLAMSGTQQPASVRAIAERQHIPAPYLEKLLIDLRQAGLVRSRRGAHGGYQLARTPREISLAEILEAVGDRIEAQPVDVPGASESGEQAEDWVMQAVWQRIATRLHQALQDITLEDLYFDARSWQAAQTEATEFVV
ncbi:MAG: RrF2 family transcriptional regulator [Cyanobacteria bacterium J06639_1]